MTHDAKRTSHGPGITPPAGELTDRRVPTPDEIVNALLDIHDGIKQRGFNEATRWSAMRSLHDTIRELYRMPPQMPALKQVIEELECIDSRLIEIVEMTKERADA